MRTRRSILVLTGLGLFTLIGLVVITCFMGTSRTTTALADDDCQYFPETNLKACGRFLQYWRANGGLAQQGFPITDVFEEQSPPPPTGDDKIHRVQYFQRARFEEHTENQAPYDVLLGLLGTEQYRNKYLARPFLVLRDKHTEAKIYDHVAKEGYYYLVLDLLITNVTPKKVLISPASITIRSTGIYDYKVDEATYALNQSLKLTNLLPGETGGRSTGLRNCQKRPAPDPDHRLFCQ